MIQFHTNSLMKRKPTVLAAIVPALNRRRQTSARNNLKVQVQFHREYASLDVTHHLEIRDDAQHLADAHKLDKNS